MDGKEIRFIDSHYNELFRIPDKGVITVTYPDGHKENKLCRYIDEYHTEIDGICYHICQWAERSEQNGRTCSVAEEPEYSLEDINADEFEFMYAKEDESIDRGCIGHLRADFDTGKAFFSTWWSEDEKYKTEEFKEEFNKIINYFRKESYTPILKSRSDMYNLCYRLKPTQSDTDKDVCGFKVITDKHTYYFRCKPRLGEYNLYAYCYNTRALEKFKNSRLIEQNIDKVDRDLFFKTDYGVKEIYFNFDSAAGGQFVVDEIKNDLIKEVYSVFKNNPDDFFGCLQEKCGQYFVDIDSPAFKSYFDKFINSKPDFEGYNKNTMKGLAKLAGAIQEKKQNKSEPER